jgi:hypothetical protein
MSAPAIIAQLKAAGVRISRRGDNLLAEPRAAVTAPLLTLIRAHKPELLATLPDTRSTDQDEQRTLEPVKFADLVALVNLVADHHAFTETQRAEAHQIAQADPVAALECFRSQGARLPTDDRIKCGRCANLRNRVCTQAAAHDAVKGYTPDPNTARRCECFKPLASASDQSTGAQRWPSLKKPLRRIH